MSKRARKYYYQRSPTIRGKKWGPYWYVDIRVGDKKHTIYIGAELSAEQQTEYEQLSRERIKYWKRKKGFYEK